jgi:threonine dehydrogenase-like Zn-dependent dehydrogenase
VIGKAVDRVKVGDMVCLPFNIGCGFCANCERGLSGYCLTGSIRKNIVSGSPNPSSSGKQPVGNPAWRCLLIVETEQRGSG